MISSLFLPLLLALQVPQITGSVETAAPSVGYSETLSREGYILGPGDVLTAVVEGGCNDVMLLSGLLPAAVCPVSGDGLLQVPGVGQIAVAGISIQEAQQQLQALVRRYYPGLSIGLSLSEPRMLNVWVSGMVEKPGRYSLLAIQRVSDLVLAAGGVTPYGSRRGVMNLPDGGTQLVDLSFGPDGQPRSDPYLVNGASVVVPLVDAPVFLARPGEVLLSTDGTVLPNARHQIEAWDSVGGETVAGFLGRTGGPEGRIDLARSVLVSGGREYPIWSSSQGIIQNPVLPGDTIRMAVLGNQVYVAGAVNHSGAILYQSGMSVRDCIDMAGGTVTSGRIGRARLYRMGEEFASGSEALSLEARPGDVIEVPHSLESRYQTTIVILASLVTMTATIINLTRN
jgi:protein involved in polysaccharide export with SLBB domain